MTHIAWRQSGLPPTHVIGAGCNLDSERLSHILDINLNTHKPAWVIGELSDNKGETERIDYSKVLCCIQCHGQCQLFHLSHRSPVLFFLLSVFVDFDFFVLFRIIIRNAALPANRVCVVSILEFVDDAHE